MVECNRTMEQARRDFADGRLKSVTLLKVPMSRGEWNLRLHGRKGDDGMLLSVHTLLPQHFDTLNQAAAAVEEIGFRCDELAVR